MPLRPGLCGTTLAPASVSSEPAMPHRTSDGQGILRHCLHPLLEPASKLLNFFIHQSVCMLNFSLYVSGTLLKGCHLVERILGLPVISSAMISIIILICKYIPLRTEQFDSLCVAQTILFKKRKKDMKFSVLIRQHILHEIGLHRVCTRLKKIKTTEPLYNVQGDSMYSIL